MMVRRELLALIAGWSAGCIAGVLLLASGAESWWALLLVLILPFAVALAVMSQR
jgi:ABC-type uncharacterized transport system permease subunit